MTTTRPVVHHAAPAIIAAGMLMAALYGYLRPDKRAAMAVALAFLGMLAALFLAIARRSGSHGSHGPHDPHGAHGAEADGAAGAMHAGAAGSARRHAEEEILRGILIGALILTVALGSKFALMLGASGVAAFAGRLPMALLGILFCLTGNALPKRLAPLTGRFEDAGRAQAAQRFIGRTWTLTGLAFAGAWLVLPEAYTLPASMFVLVCGMGLVMSRCAGARVWRRV